jgi:phospholipid/cholesterol/gamma-HCH transport system substrate-binding protein
MEFKARYRLMGLFALAVIGAGFLFVYWLEAGGGLGRRITYQIRFVDSVAGLAKGSAVLFNGVRIGEVSRLDLAGASPNEVLVEVAVDATAPVRSDSKASIEFQGLAGAPTVALAGGSPEQPMLATLARHARVLAAEKDAGQTMTKSARDTLRHIDRVIADNAAPLKSAIASIDRFATALANNSDKVDGIMAGLDRLTGGGTKTPTRIYELRVAPVAVRPSRLPEGVLQIVEPTALAYLDTDKIMMGDGDLVPITNAQWSDALPRVVQAGLLRAFESIGYRQAIGKAPEGVKVDRQLLVEVRRFQIRAGAVAVAEVDIGVRLMTVDGLVSDVKTFAARVPLAGPASEAQAAVDALSQAFSEIAAGVVAYAGNGV